MSASADRPQVWHQLCFNADANDASAVPVWVDCTDMVRKITMNRRGNWWSVNGSQLNSSQTSQQATAANDAGVSARLKHVFLNVGDYLELFAYQESGGNLNTDQSALRASGMSVRWVSN